MMNKYLFIAEKPSLMRDVRSCYNNHTAEIKSKVGAIDFVALSGHVCRNYEPEDYPEWQGIKWNEIEFPMIPQQWGIKMIDDAGKRKTILNIKNAVKNYDGVIVGTDSDVEGYGIYYLLEHYLHLENMPTLRFIEHSLTDREILKSLLEMTDYHTDPTHIRFVQSFLIRSRADWLYGLNGTRMLSLKNSALLKVGRVKAPTIKLVYDNSIAIERFKPQKFFVLTANYGSFSSTLIGDDGMSTQFADIKAIPKYKLCGVIKRKITKKTHEHAPKLFDLAAIQAEAGRVYGFKPSETLEIIQSLYERHKVISYPRTQCRYVSAEKAKEFPMMLSHMVVFDDLKPIAQSIPQSKIQEVICDKAVVNDAEVQKESHDALLPTSNRPDLNKMTQAERDICHMIYKRLLAQFMNKLTEEKTELDIIHQRDDETGSSLFHARGRVVVDPGWSVLYRVSKDSLIPPLNEGDSIVAKQMTPVQRTTTPPKRLTQATLVNAMRNIASQIEDRTLKKALADSQGIGTPATRASIISDIISSGYVDDKKDGLYITQIGKAYIDNIKTLDIISPVFAAGIENKIKMVQRGETTYESVESEMLSNLKEMCAQINTMESKSMPTNMTNTQCPVCKSTLCIQKYNYLCPKCSLKIPRFVCGKEIDERLLQRLVTGKISPLITFEKKDNTRFRACLVLKDGVLSFTSGFVCPVCGSAANLNNGGVFCDCGFKLFRNCCGHSFSDRELKSLIEGKTLSGISDFKGKSGKPFQANVFLDGGHVKFEFAK